LISRPDRGKLRLSVASAIKRDLLGKIAAGTFRQDQFHRLDVMRVNIPRVRERREDVSLLAEHLLKQIAAQRQRVGKSPRTAGKVNASRGEV
jgi:two-component system, NtrC family, C4-dicarboxylate transport response regulator DctD